MVRKFTTKVPDEARVDSARDLSVIGIPGVPGFRRNSSVCRAITRDPVALKAVSA
jgi:hypothetical protein